MVAPFSKKLKDLVFSGKGARGVAGRINHSREKSFMEKLGRPTRILLRPGDPDTSVVSGERGGSLDPEASVHTSR